MKAHRAVVLVHETGRDITRVSRRDGGIEHLIRARRRAQLLEPSLDLGFSGNLGRRSALPARCE
jgi:hypothetical protein